MKMFLNTGPSEFVNILWLQEVTFSSFPWYLKIGTLFSLNFYNVPK